MNQAKDPGADVKGLTGWTPYFLEQNYGEPRVRWLRVGQAGFAEPFFHRTVRRRLAEPDCQFVSTRIRDLELLPRVAPCLAPSGFIFHMSRAGSTLLANVFKASGEHLVISEPSPVNQLLGWPGRHLEPELWRRRFQGLLACLGQPLEARQRHYIVKFSSPNVLEIEWILQAFPGVPWVFLYRNPHEVLASALAKPPGWLNLYLRPQDAASRLGLATEEITGLGRVDFGALVLSRFCQSALAAADRGGALVNYRQLAPARLEALARHFGLTPDANQLARMGEAFNYDAKADTQRSFTPGFAAERDDIDPAIRQACAGPLEQLYGALEARRATL